VPANFQSAGQEEAPAPRGWVGAGALISILCALHKTGEGCSIAAAMPAVLDQPFFATCPRCGDAMPLVRTMRSLWVLPEVRVFVCTSRGEVETRELLSERRDEDIRASQGPPNDAQRAGKTHCTGRSFGSLH
jgi:hypothetical protein